MLIVTYTMNYFDMQVVTIDNPEQAHRLDPNSTVHNLLEKVKKNTEDQQAILDQMDEMLFAGCNTVIVEHAKEACMLYVHPPFPPRP